MSGVVRVLLVEDNPADVRLLQEALRFCRTQIELPVVEDGEAALDYLFRRGVHQGAPRPDLVLLDLNLPRKNGMEVLAELKADEQLRTLPVVVLSTSDSESDINRSYALHANCYVRKPPGLDDFIRIVQAIDDFWFTIVKLPPNDQAGDSPATPMN